MLPYTYQWSAPYIRIISQGNGMFSIGQNPMVLSSDLPFSFYDYQWTIPYRYQINGSSLSATKYLISITDTLDINVGPNVPVIFNPQGQTHARVLYDDTAWAPIQTTLMTNPMQIDEISRAQILSDTWAFVQKKRLSWERFLNLTLYLQKETSPLVWRTIIRDGSYIQVLWDNFRYQKTYSNLMIYYNTITSGMPTPNFTLTQDWSINTANALMADMKCGIGERSCMLKAKSSFATFIQQCQNSAYGTGKCNPVPSDFRAVQLCYGLKQSAKDHTTLLSLFQWWQSNPPANDYFPFDMEYLLNALSCSQDPGVVNDLITSTLNGSIPSIFLSFVAQNDIGGSMLSNYLAVHQGDVLNSPLFDKYIQQMVTDWSTDTQHAFLLNVNSTYPLSPSQKKTVQSAITTVETLQNWLSTEGTPIAQWLGNFASSLAG
jgi:hypothetical protein